MRIQWIIGNQTGTIDDIERQAAESAVTSGQAVFVDVEPSEIMPVAEPEPLVEPTPEPDRASIGLPPIEPPSEPAEPMPEPPVEQA
jgi:hypothetical protein